MSSERQIGDGGEAFPTPETENFDPMPGMSLRDWYAGQALVGLLSTGWRGRLFADVAVEAFTMAEEMLQERKDRYGK